MQLARQISLKVSHAPATIRMKKIEAPNRDVPHNRLLEMLRTAKQSLLRKSTLLGKLALWFSLDKLANKSQLSLTIILQTILLRANLVAFTAKTSQELPFPEIAALI